MAPDLPLGLLGMARLPLAAFGLGLARCLGLLQIIPVATRLGLTGIHRATISAALALLAIPMLLPQLSQADIAGPRLALLTAKEALIGMILGVLFAVPFWAAEVAGELLDSQRGSRSAVVSDPVSQEQNGVLATLLALTLTTLFFISGGMHWIIQAILGSYQVWPVGDLAPALRLAAYSQILAMLDGTLGAGLILAGPLLIAMLLAEIGLALVSRFAPQLNVFDLALSLKGLIVVAGLPVYAVFLIGYLRGSLAPLTDLMPTMRALAGR